MTRIENFDLTNFNGYKIRSSCKVAYFPQTETEIVDILKAHDNLIILGSGNNSILSKSYYESPFLIFNGDFNKVHINGNIIEAESGLSLEKLSLIALKHSLTGLEFCYDIPSSIGGAVIMNAGTKEGVISDVLLKVRYIDLGDLKIKELEVNDMEMSYRSSFFQKNETIVLRAWFRLSTGVGNSIKKMMEETKKRRWNSQPREFPSCGSVFKRPHGFFVGKMIDDLGLKGFSIGGARISDKHSGFIINYNNASGKDILELIEFIQKKVFEKYNVNLDIEQRIIS